MLEILNLSKNSAVAEVPMIFEERRFGESKADLRIFHQFVCQLVTLRIRFVSPEFVSFAIVGTSGLVVHLLVFHALLSLGFIFQNAHIIAALGAITNNYFLNKHLTFSDPRQTTSYRLMSWSLYLMAAGVSLMANTGVAVFLNSQTGLVTFSSLCGLVLGVSWNFFTGRIILTTR